MRIFANVLSFTALRRSITTTNQIVCHERNDRATPTDDATTSFTCPSCPNTAFSKLKSFRQHMLNHRKWRRCQICLKSLYGDAVEAHLCGDQEQIHCEYCDENFTTTVDLVKHLNSHTAKQFYHCEKCNKFMSMKILKEYHVEQHAKQPKRHNCKTCSKSFSSKEHLNNHMRHHSSERSTNH